ncbi:uncharacterized protein [Lepeophtheirus salmonis]|uniref:Uncharacterized protein n=2 Tax=Lepeophtheirus salmonis TaxID=72036 RepID=A7TZA9_LEPSM|nr:uncharacterized protein LOC121120680 [Lepeophtheirus salmonis]ABU41105.1 hypothetical protein [Lepeophtheirus salmonis]
MRGIYIGIVLATCVYWSNAQQFAPAPINSQADCQCQCIALSFYDEYGQQQGNCRSTFNGAQWCYVENDGYSSCPDLKRSTRYRGKYYSNHACITLPAYSPECLGFVIYNEGNSGIQNSAPPIAVAGSRGTI